MHAHFKNTLPQFTRAHGLNDLAACGVFQFPGVVRIRITHARFNLFHEGVGDVHAMVKVERLEVGVTRGLTHLNKLNHIGVINVEKCGVGAAAGGTLAVRKARGIVDAQMRHHAHALIVGAADVDVNADAAPEHRKPVDLGERVHKPLSTVGHVA